MGGLLRDFMRVFMTRPWIGRTGINALWGRGDRAIPWHGAHFPCVDRPLDVAWAGSQPDGSKGVGWVGGWDHLGPCNGDRVHGVSEFWPSGPLGSAEFIH